MQLQISQYKILSLLGSGSQHLVYKAEYNLFSEFYAIKLENSCHTGQVENEIEMLKKLTDIEGVPRLIEYGVTKDNRNYLVIPLFHSNLKELIRSQRISQSLILHIGLRILEILEKIHKNNILHLDIKPENIMMSKSISSEEDFLKPGFIQLIDFGLSQNFKDNSESLQDIFIGSLNFASRSSHTGSPLGYKDDLESLLYVLYYLKDSRLPWSENVSYGFHGVELDDIGKKKQIFFRKNLHSRYSSNFLSSFISYVDELENNIMPDYNYIKDIFNQLIQSLKCQQFPSNKVRLKTQCKQDIKQNGEWDIVKLCQQNNFNEIILDNISKKKTIMVSSLICNYKTSQIKSIKDIQQKT